MAAPRHIRIISRVTTVVVLVIVIAMITWLFTGMPASVETALADALWAPCPPRYASARTAQDTTDADAFVLKPRSRFERAITCGTLRARMDSLPAKTSKPAAAAAPASERDSPSTARDGNLSA
jgi:hypothetical protein